MKITISRQGLLIKTGPETWQVKYAKALLSVYFTHWKKVLTEHDACGIS